MESTLGHAREHLDHRVGTLVLVHLTKLQHIRAVCKKSTAQEGVHEEYVADLKRRYRINLITKSLILLFLFVEAIL